MSADGSFFRVKRFLRLNGLSIFLICAFLITYLGGQVFSGWFAHNDEKAEHSEKPLSLAEYLTSAHFMEATTENWESEFLQMFVYVYATAFLFQKGSVESNDPDSPPEKRPVTANSPWPVRRGGLWCALYAHSLSLCFGIIFLITFVLHACASVRLENEERERLGQAGISLGEHLKGSQFWFESFQNWQSEFLAIGCMVIFSIFLRETGSPESKPVQASHEETGR
jgi:hypothetical protein